MRALVSIIAAAVLFALPHGVQARDAALIMIGEDYEKIADHDKAPGVTGLARDLELAGFKVTSSTDQGPAETWKAVERFRDDAAAADRVFIFVSGHIVHTARDSWMLTRRALPDLSDASIGRFGLPIGALVDIAAEHPGQALVMVAPSALEVTGPGIAPGLAGEAPQGVTLVTGPGQRLVRLARNVALVPGTRLRQALTPVPGGMTVSGFLSDAVPFLPGQTPIVGGPSGPAESDMEIAFWNVVLELDAPASYRAYLERYPNGRFRDIARAKINGAALDAEAQALATEAALGLDRKGRREIQRNLSLLGYNPRGVDGIFGPGSRAAIKAWQRDNGHDANGYLTALQVRRLNAAGKARADELAAEAAARKAQEEKRDTQYWRDTGRGATEAGLRAYLGRYPDGLFADVAEARLAEINADKRSEAEAEERAFWDKVRKKDKASEYQRYLDRFPKGLFADDAKARIKKLKDADKAALKAAAKEEERGIVPNTVLRLLVENRLAAAGQDPGAIDGKFDKTSRRAIRRFQKAQGLQVTGYVTQATMVRLLAVP